MFVCVWGGEGGCGAEWLLTQRVSVSVEEEVCFAEHSQGLAQPGFGVVDSLCQCVRELVRH